LRQEEISLVLVPFVIADKPVDQLTIGNSRGVLHWPCRSDGHDESLVFEPWPSDAPPAWREAYLAAYAILDSDAAYAAVLLQKLIAERPADLAVRRLAERLPPMRKSDRSPT